MDNDVYNSPRLRTMQIISLAIMAGLVIFVILLTVLRLNRQDLPSEAWPILSVVSFVVLAMNLIMARIVPRLQLKTTLAHWAAAGDLRSALKDNDKLLGLVQTQHIIILALLEAAGFLGAIAFFVEGHYWVLACPVIALCLMALIFPTAEKIRAKIDRFQSRLDELGFR